MSFLLELIEEYGLAVVFFNVLIEQAGAPVPAYPTLVITGALAGQGKYDFILLLFVALAAAMTADVFWYLAGRRYGRRVMAMLCRISLSPDSCVRQTENIFGRWGAPSLLVAKFIPGFASLASALAGATGISLAAFILFDALGTILWAGSAIYLGFLFSAAVADLLDVLEQLGKGGLLLLAFAIAAFVVTKWWQRHRFLRGLRMARISVDELYELMQQEQQPLIVDVRAPGYQQEGRIPGAVTFTLDTAALLASQTPDHVEVIIYCACPNEASAVYAARELMKHGIAKVRPLHGGIDAWRDAGYLLESP